MFFSLYVGLSAAFDTINHNNLFNRLESKTGLTGKALNWYKSYSTGRITCVLINNNFSKCTWYGVWAPARLNCWTEVFYDLCHSKWSNIQAKQSFISNFMLMTFRFLPASYNRIHHLLVCIACTWIMHKRYQQIDDRKYVETELW